jgi:hypothetical protein
VRNSYEILPNGSLGPHKTRPSIAIAIRAGGRKRDYSRIAVPILALSWYPPPLEDQLRAYQPKTAEERISIEEFYAANVTFVRRRMQALLAANAPVRVIEMPGASRLIFLSHQAQVLQEFRRFMSSLR